MLGNFCMFFYGTWIFSTFRYTISVSISLGPDQEAWYGSKLFAKILEIENLC